MLEELKAWWIVLTKMGPVMKVGQEVDRIFRYHALSILAREGLFDYLKMPRTYGQTLAEFGFVDNAYTRSLFDILASDTQGLLIKDQRTYHVNPDKRLPHFEQVMDQTNRHIHSVSHMAEGMAKNILPRLRDQIIEISSTFEEDGRDLVTKFDMTLGNRIYSALRSTAFALLTTKDRQSISGKKLLNVGCGSGREPAELWLHFKGDIQITAIDPVNALLDVARKFSSLLDEIQPGHPPLTEANQPTFKQAGATHLPFENNSFDAVFYSQVLHWTPDPRKAISEIVRIVKPGGLIFGTQGCKPQANPYLDLIIRTNDNCHGFFWIEEYRRWYAEQGLLPKIVTPVGAFKVYKRS